MAEARPLALRDAVRARYRTLRQELVRRLTSRIATIQVAELSDCHQISSVAQSFEGQLARCQGIDSHEVMDQVFNSAAASARNQAICQSSRGASTPEALTRYTQSLRQQAQDYAVSRCAHNYIAHFPTGQTSANQQEQRHRVEVYQNSFLRGECAGDIGNTAIGRAQTIAGSDLRHPLSEDTALAGPTANQPSLADQIRRHSDERMTCEETAVQPGLVGRSISELSRLGTQTPSQIPAFSSTPSFRSASSLLAQACQAQDDRTRLRRGAEGTLLGRESALGLDELEDLVGGAHLIPFRPRAQTVRLLRHLPVVIERVALTVV